MQARTQVEMKLENSNVEEKGDVLPHDLTELEKSQVEMELENSRVEEQGVSLVVAPPGLADFFMESDRSFVMKGLVDMNSLGKINLPRQWEPIFLNEKRSDRCRSQLRLYGELLDEYPWIVQIAKLLNSTIGTLFPGYAISEPISLLKSTGRGLSQQPHDDFDPSKVVEHPPFGCLLSVSGNSRLLVRERGLMVESCALDRGDIIFFRGVHAGCAYKRVNVRLHFYVAHQSSVPLNYGKRTYF